jgi:outer membrane biosynthesis protein TonB
MRLPSGKRLGQSGYELALAVFFTFFIHAAVVAAALFLSVMAIPKKVIPPVYQVKLVGLPQELVPALLPTTPVEPAPAPPQPEPVKKIAPPSPKPGKPAVKPIKAAPNKNAMPELSSQKPKPAAIQPTSVETTDAQPPAKAAAEKAAPSSGGGAENVAVTTPQQDFKFPYYLVSVRNKIGQNWRPPPDAKDAKARVIFTINRSGWVGDVNLDSEYTSGTFGFQQAAIRAIRASNPFPRLPEEFSKQSLQFTVDLMAE